MPKTPAIEPDIALEAQQLADMWIGMSTIVTPAALRLHSMKFAVELMLRAAKAGKRQTATFIARELRAQLLIVAERQKAGGG